MLPDLPASLIFTLVEESLDAVLIIDEHCTICYANQSMQQLSGYGGDELAGQPLDTLLPEAIAAFHSGHVRDYTLGEKKSTVLGNMREFEIRHRNGREIPIGLKAINLGTHDGKRYFGAFIEDFRPRRRLEAKHAALLARLEQEAMTDALTEIANRRAFDAEANHMMAWAKRNGTTVAVGIADIDHFKKINDCHGHMVGDAVLREVARRMVGAARTTDFIARIGGEEFGLLFPDTGAETAIVIAQRIREAIAATPIQTDDGVDVHTTISIGLATMAPGTELDDALAEADSALYSAKGGGRNRVEIV